MTIKKVSSKESCKRAMAIAGIAATKEPILGMKLRINAKNPNNSAYSR